MLRTENVSLAVEALIFPRFPLKKMLKVNLLISSKTTGVTKVQRS